MQTKPGKCPRWKWPWEPLNGKYLKILYGRIQVNAQWRIRSNNETLGLHKDINVVTHTELRRLKWPGHICRMDGSGTPRKMATNRVIRGDQMMPQNCYGPPKLACHAIVCVASLMTRSFYTRCPTVRL